MGLLEPLWSSLSDERDFRIIMTKKISQGPRGACDIFCIFVGLINCQELHLCFLINYDSSGSSIAYCGDCCDAYCSL